MEQESLDVYERIELLERATDRLAQAWDNLDPHRAMVALADANKQLMEIAPELVEQGVRAGLSQRAMALALGVPESALRGARREFSR